MILKRGTIVSEKAIPRSAKTERQIEYYVCTRKPLSGGQEISGGLIKCACKQVHRSSMLAYRALCFLILLSKILAALYGVALNIIDSMILCNRYNHVGAYNQIISELADFDLNNDIELIFIQKHGIITDKYLLWWRSFRHFLEKFIIWEVVINGG